jgi:hypothetical protein
MKKTKIIKLIAEELNLRNLSESDIENLTNLLSDKLEENKDEVFQNVEIPCIRKKYNWNIFKLPFDCVYIYRTIERIAFREECDKILTDEKDDKLTIRYLSNNNPVWSKIRMEIKDFMKLNYLLTNSQEEI